MDLKRNVEMLLLLLLLQLLLLLLSLLYKYGVHKCVSMIF